MRTFGQPHIFGELLGIPNPTGSSFQVYLTSFNQTFSAELLTNATIAGDPPAGWTVGETPPDPELTEVGTGLGHGGGGTGSQNFFSSATNFSPALTQASVYTQFNRYLTQAVISYDGGGTLQLQNPSNDSIIMTVATTYKMMVHKLATTDARLQVLTASGGTPLDMTVDSFSVKEITLNTQQTGLADGISDFHMTLPGSPKPGEECALLYRISDATNYWRCKLIFGPIEAVAQWRINLEKVVAGVKTAFTVTTLTGIVPEAIRVVHNGSAHDVYTLNSSVWTQRGTTVTDSALATATGVNVVYSDEITPTLLQVDFP